MTFNEIVTHVTDRTNLTSSEAIARVGRFVNDRYRRVTTAIGLNITRRTTVFNDATAGVDTLTFYTVEKLINVVDRSTTPYRILKEVTPDELRSREPFVNSFASNYAIIGVGSNFVTILMDCIPTAAFTLYADAYATAPILSGTQEPAFAESFHDVIMYGALADELGKMRKLADAQVAESMYEKRLSELRFFIAKSASLDIYQGKTKNGFKSTSVGARSAGIASRCPREYASTA